MRGRVQGASGPELLARIVDTMAPIEPELIEMDWAAVPALSVAPITSQRALVVLLTSIDAPGASRGLLSVLPQLTRKHTVVVASVTDPETLRAAAARGPAGGLPRRAPQSAPCSTSRASRPRSGASAPMS